MEDPYQVILLVKRVKVSLMSKTKLSKATIEIMKSTLASIVTTKARIENKRSQQPKVSTTPPISQETRISRAL